jgi:hypothetical protein
MEIPRTTDTVACHVIEILRKMASEGYGSLTVGGTEPKVWVAFGATKVEAENYDIALVRLAGALLEDVTVGNLFLKRIRERVDSSIA